jgi:hypothetical protein
METLFTARESALLTIVLEEVNLLRQEMGLDPRPIQAFHDRIRAALRKPHGRQHPQGGASWLS